MSLLIIEDNLNVRITGGQKYNHILYDRLLKEKETSTLLDKDIKTFKFSFLYNISYLLQYSKIKDYDYVLIGSSFFYRMFFFLFVFKLFNRKVKFTAIHHHFIFKTKKNLMKKFLIKFFEISFLKLFNEIIIPSKYTLDISEKYLDKNKITYIPLGFNNKNSTNNKNFVNDKKLNLLFVGSVYQRKGLLYLIKALNKIKNENFKLNIIGQYSNHDKYYKFLKKNIEKYDLNYKINFIGRVSAKNLETFYKEADVFIFPSLYEGFGMVLAEALIHNLPVICFNNSAMPYLIKNNYNGFLVKDRDILELSNTILKIINNKNILNKMRENIIQSVKNLNSYENMLIKMENFVSKKFK